MFDLFTRIVLFNYEGAYRLNNKNSAMLTVSNSHEADWIIYVIVVVIFIYNSVALSSFFCRDGV